MKHLSTDTNIPNSIATTVTMFDAQERERREREIAACVKWLDERLARGARQVFSENVTVSPVLAGLILHRNPDNRRVAPKLVREIRADLENGHWVFNGETIIISSDGLLNDGQHRLTACRDSGVPIRTMIVFGVPRSARLTTDQGKARTAGDYLSMGGRVEDPIVVAAVARLIWQWNASGSIETRGVRPHRTPTKAEVHGAAIDHADAIQRSLARVKRGFKTIGCSRSLIAFCHFLFAKHDEEAANAFIGRLVDGADISEQHPIFTLRARFFRDPKMSARDRFEAIVRAWNAMREGRPLEKIQLMGRLPEVAR